MKRMLPAAAACLLLFTALVSGCRETPSPVAFLSEAERAAVDAAFRDMATGELRTIPVAHTALTLGKGDGARFLSGEGVASNPLSPLWSPDSGRDELIQRSYTPQSSALTTTRALVDAYGGFHLYLGAPPDGYAEKEAIINRGEGYTLIYESSDGGRLGLQAHVTLLDGASNDLSVYQFRKLGNYTVMSDFRDYSGNPAAVIERQTLVSVDIDSEGFLFPVVGLFSDTLGADELAELLGEVVIKHPHGGYEALYSRAALERTEPETHRLFQGLSMTDWQDDMFLGDGYPVLMPDLAALGGARSEKLRGALSGLRICRFRTDGGSMLSWYGQIVGERERALLEPYTALDYAMAYVFNAAYTDPEQIEAYGIALTASDDPVFWLMSREGAVQVGGPIRTHSGPVLQIEALAERDGALYYERLIVPAELVPQHDAEAFVRTLDYLE